jgi:predicted small metal-binding protein
MDNQLSTTELKTLFERYYHPIINMFGHITYTGCTQLAYACVFYEPGLGYNEVLKRTAEHLHTTHTAIKRNIKIYLDAVNKDVSIQDMSTYLGYNFPSKLEKMTPFELIPVLKFSIDGILVNTVVAE